jgi:hypothetical protein
MLSGGGSRPARAERAITRVVALLTVLLAAPVSASADPAPSSAPVGNAEKPEDRRTALYREGVEAATAGLWADARDRFRQALAIRTSPKVLFSLAQAEEQLGQVASAQADYGRALEGAKAAGEGEVSQAAEEAQRAIEPRVPHVRIFVSGAPPSSASATLDQAPVAVGTSIAADPGAHRLVVNSPGMREVTASIAIGERQQLDVPVRLEPVGPEAARSGLARPEASKGSGLPAEGSTSRASPWRTIGLVIGGTGVVALGVGTALGLVAKSENDESNTSGCHGNNCTPEAAAMRHDALNAATASTASFVAGGVLAAAGVVIWLVAPSSGVNRSLGAAPVVTASGGGLLLTGRW